MRHREREWRLENRLAERRYCFGKSSPSAPAAPDYAGAATAQGAANLQSGQQSAVLSNPNVNSPYGSQQVSYAPLGGSDPNTAGFLSPTVTQTLNPQSQQIFDAQQATKLGLAGLGQQGIGTAQNAMGNPFQYAGPGIQTDLQNPTLQSSFQAPNVQSSLNTSGVSAIPTVDPAARQHAEDTAYQAATSRLDPQWQQRQSMLDTQLTNQGLAPGGEAYDAAKRDLGYQQNDAYLQAQANAVNQGLTSQQAQFGMGLAANQTGFGQAATQGQFANTAAGQQYGQNQGLASFGNQAAGQQFGQGLQAGQFGNTAEQQSLAQQLQLRNQPLNEITALMSGSQINNPQFQGYQGTSIAPAPIAAAAAQQGQYGQGIYNAQVGATNAANSGLYGLGAAGLGAVGLINRAV